MLILHLLLCNTIEEMPIAQWLFLFFPSLWRPMSCESLDHLIQVWGILGEYIGIVIRHFVVWKIDIIDVKDDALT